VSEEVWEADLRNERMKPKEKDEPENRKQKPKERN